MKIYRAIAVYFLHENMRIHIITSYATTQTSRIEKEQEKETEAAQQRKRKGRIKSFYIEQTNH